MIRITVADNGIGAHLRDRAAQRRDAEARNQLAVMNARRYRDLGNQKFVSSSAVEAKLQEEVSARAGLNAAEANLAAAEYATAAARERTAIASNFATPADYAEVVALVRTTGETTLSLRAKLAAKVRCVFITPLDRPVVPPVGKIAMTSSGSRP